MSMLDTLQATHTAARIAKDTLKLDLLSTLLGELQTLASRSKSPTSLSEDEICKTIKFFIKNNKEVMALSEEGSDKYSTLLKENEVLEGFLPKPLSASDILEKVQSLVVEYEVGDLKTAMRSIMPYFKRTYPNQYDPQDVISAIKNTLNIPL